MSLDPAMIEMFMNSNNGHSQNDLISMLQQQGNVSPKTQMLLKMMSENSAEGEIVDDEIETEWTEHKPGLKNLSKSVDTDVQEIIEELEDALEMIDTLAEAIGACSDCFGGDKHCRSCQGRGTSGWKQPNHELFSYFIMPAVKRVKSKRMHYMASQKIKNVAVQGHEEKRNLSTEE